MVSRAAVVLLIGLLGMVYQATQLPPPNRTDESPNDELPLASPRIRLGDGRYLAYTERGVPKAKAKHKIIIVHGFGSSKDMNFLAPQVRKLQSLFSFFLVFFIDLDLNITVAVIKIRDGQTGQIRLKSLGSTQVE